MGAFWRVREVVDEDLDTLVPMWDDPATGGAEPVFGVSELLAAVRAGEPAVVATVGEEIVGSAVATVHGSRGWVLRLSLGTRWRQQGLGSALLAELERHLVARGVRRVSALLPGRAELGPLALAHSGYEARPGLVLYERLETPTRPDAGALGRLGGRMIRRDLWDDLRGMAREKDLIERTVTQPLARPDLAGRLGLEPPRAVVLFGPPGTGKTTFAKGVAGRLGWPFVELFPSRLAADSPSGLAGALRDAFALVDELDDVVLFIDEVEEIAGRREESASPRDLAVTNELLKLIPGFRERDGRLLVCATNSVRTLDGALLRHGRFDYVIPVGPPDAEARRAIWGRYLASIPHEPDLDLDAVVARSALLTPADIEFAARRTAQTVFERSLAKGEDQQAVTGDLLDALEATRPTLTPRTVADFEQDIVDHARC